jgi:hypothetical protein
LNNINLSWISTGLREFWDKATVLRLAALACCKQYCLTPSEAEGELYCVGKAQNRSPKIICSLDFLFLFYQEKRKEVLYCLRRTKDDELYSMNRVKNNNPKMFCKR